MKYSLMLLCSLSTLSLAACSQDDQAVHVQNKGHLFYGHDGIQRASFTSIARPNINKYNPSPYSPDYRVGNGKVQMEAFTPIVAAQPSPATYRVENSAIGAVQSSDLAPPSKPWTPPTISNHSRVHSAANQSATFIPPVEGSVASNFGKQENGAVNDGVNYMLPAGEPVYASAAGEIAYVGDELKSYGTMAIIKHENGYNTSYAHLGRATVSKGASVQQGQIIGYVGQSGNVERPQLHFAIRKGADPVNPSTLLSKQLAAN